MTTPASISSARYCNPGYCNRQFVEDPQWQPKAKDTFGLVNLLLLKKIPLAGIARVTQVSDSWLQTSVNDADAEVARTASVRPKAQGQLTVQMDELWSFVDDKGHQQWVWLAMDADTREIIGCHVGDRSRASAQQLWQSLPAVYRQCAQIYTDYGEACTTVIPSQRHFAVGKESGLYRFAKLLLHILFPGTLAPKALHSESIVLFQRNGINQLHRATEQHDAATGIAIS